MKIPFHVGDTIQVHQKIIEKEKIAGKTKREVKEEQKERIQVFEGVVIAVKNREENTSFTVRKISIDNIGVERIWPLISPWISKIVVKKKGDVRRAKLYYLRNLVGKKAKKIESGEKPRGGVATLRGEKIEEAAEGKPAKEKKEIKAEQPKPIEEDRAPEIKAENKPEEKQKEPSKQSV